MVQMCWFCAYRVTALNTLGWECSNGKRGQNDGPRKERRQCNQQTNVRLSSFQWAVRSNGRKAGAEFSISRSTDIARHIMLLWFIAYELRLVGGNDVTDPAGCLIDIRSGYCKRHPPSRMFQIFSLKLAKTPTDDRPIQLYGYIAVRDHLDLLLNYVVNFRRDDPISVEQGSSISMIGPKRGIDLSGNIVVEYDMRIKTEEVKHDLQLIDGASMIRHKDLQDCRAFTRRIHGDHGAIDLTVSALDDAVEATVEVVISEVRSGFALRLGCFIGGVDEEIPIFDGVVGSEAHGLKLKKVCAGCSYKVLDEVGIQGGTGVGAVSVCLHGEQPWGFLSEYEDGFCIVLSEGDMVVFAFAGTELTPAVQELKLDVKIHIT
uniref:DUF6598 domain-containing protein n=1 Tax=Aegilops tauschii TaxID=37682 RepID=M8CEZ2_AEGTA